jgi:hypothetical protein
LGRSKAARDQQIKNTQDRMRNHEFTTELCEYQRQHYEDLLNKILELASRKQGGGVPMENVR